MVNKLSFVSETDHSFFIFLQTLKRHSASSYIWEISTEEGLALPDELNLKFQVNYGKDMIFEDTPFHAHFDFKDFKVRLTQLNWHLWIVPNCDPFCFRPCICSSVVSIQPKVAANYAKLPVSVLCPSQWSRSTIAATHP